MIWPEAKKAQFNIPFTLVIKDRRRSKVTDSPAPFRCTIGEFYGPAAWLIHSMTKERGSWLCFSYDKIRRAIYCREKRDRLELPGSRKDESSKSRFYYLTYDIYFLFIFIICQAFRLWRTNFLQKNFFLKKERPFILDFITYLIDHPGLGMKEAKYRTCL